MIGVSLETNMKQPRRLHGFLRSAPRIENLLEKQQNHAVRGIPYCFVGRSMGKSTVGEEGLWS